uniref:Uncharacterized protein n=1 Tax=Anguilla anguilla TaxID=7936 RepID=A0A0E9VY21_ANGAN
MYELPGASNTRTQAEQLVGHERMHGFCPLLFSFIGTPAIPILKSYHHLNHSTCMCVCVCLLVSYIQVT